MFLAEGKGSVMCSKLETPEILYFFDNRPFHGICMMIITRVLVEINAAFANISLER